MQQGVEVVRVDAATDDVRMLVGLLNDELGSLYSPQQRHGLNLDALFQPHIRFFVAYWRGQPAGCGGVALLDGFAEIKRMYVRSAWRGEGIADVIMARLVAEAAGVGHTVMRLETGVYSGAAIAFYRRQGFVACAAFEPYASMPKASVLTSVFMEKAILKAPGGMSCRQ